MAQTNATTAAALRAQLVRVEESRLREARRYAQENSDLEARLAALRADYERTQVCKPIEGAAEREARQGPRRRPFIVPRLAGISRGRFCASG